MIMRELALVLVPGQVFGIARVPNDEFLTFIHWDERGVTRMPVNLSIKNVPDEVARALRNRAAVNQRSLQEELLAILKQVAKDTPPVTIDRLLEHAQRKKPALDETASTVLAAKSAEQERAARRFQDLWGKPDDSLGGGPSTEER